MILYEDNLCLESELLRTLNYLVETTTLSKRRIRVLTADNWEISVGLGEDDNFGRSVTEVKGNGNIGVFFIVDIFDGIGGPGSMDGVAEIGSIGRHDGDGRTGDIGAGVDNGDLQTGILCVHVFTRIDLIVLRIVAPGDVGAEDDTTSQLFHQFSSTPLRFEVDAGEGFETVDSLTLFGGATLVLKFNGGDGGGNKSQSRDELGEDHSDGSC